VSHGAPEKLTLLRNSRSGVSQAGYTVRARSTELRKWECTMTISKTSGYNPVCTEISAEWTGTDPAA